MHRITGWARDMRDLWRELDRADPIVPDTLPTPPGTQDWRAPHVHDLGEFSYPVDIVRDDNHAW